MFYDYKYLPWAFFFIKQLCRRLFLRKSIEYFYLMSSSVVVLGTIDPSGLLQTQPQSLRARCFPLKVATDQRQALHFTLACVYTALRRIMRIVRSKRQPQAEERVGLGS